MKRSKINSENSWRQMKVFQGMWQRNFKTEFYNDTDLSGKTRNISNKQPHLPSKGIKQRRIKPKINRRK